ncbi:hypothetical protein [Pseudomonas gingeri]
MTTAQSKYTMDGIDLLKELGVEPVAHGVWAFTDIDTASNCYVHHSQQPTALAAYAIVNPTFAAGRFPGYLLRDLVDKMPCLDYAEYAALASVTGAPQPSFAGQSERSQIFGKAVWAIVEKFQLQGCFMRVDRGNTNGDHYNLRPRGVDYAGSWDVIPEDIKALRKAYRAMSPIQQVMTITIMRLYNQNKDTVFLTGCPTKIPAAEAITILQDHDALKDWGHLVTHYAGW